MTSADLVTLDVSGGVGHLALNAPDAGNVLDIPFATALKTRVDEAAGRADVGAVLLTGNGRFFSAGGDLKAMRAAPDRGAYVTDLVAAAHAAVRSLAALEKPVVAAVHGSAAGAGLSLVLLSDIVLTTPKTSFVTAYTAVGLTPDCGQSWLLPRAVGTSRALELMLTSRRFGGDEAVALGIAARAVPEESLLSEAHDVARSLAGPRSHALGSARALIRSGYAAGFDEHLDREQAAIAAAVATEATGALIDAFLAPKP